MDNPAAGGSGEGRRKNRLLFEAFLAVLLLLPVIWLARNPHSPEPAPQVASTGVSSLLASSTQLLVAGRFEESLAVAQQALRTDPNSADAHNNVGICYMKLGKWDDALAHVREAIRLRPDFQLAKNNVGWIQSERAKAEGASAGRPPAGADQLLAASVQHYQAGRWQECIDTAREVLKLDPRMAAAYNNISAASNQLGMWDESIRNAKEAIRLQADFPLAKSNLAAAEAGKRAN